MTELPGHGVGAPDLEAESADDLDTFLEEQLQDPEFQGHFEDAQTRHELLDDLLAARAGARLTQAQVATRMGTTQSAVSQIEAGGSDPRVSTLQRYARAVGAYVSMQVIPVSAATYTGELSWTVNTLYGGAYITAGLKPKWLSLEPLASSGSYFLLADAVPAPVSRGAPRRAPNTPVQTTRVRAA